MEKHLIIVSASDGTGNTYSNVYVSDIGADDKVIAACKRHYETIYEEAVYLDRGSVQTIRVGEVYDTYTSAKACLVNYEKELAEQEAEELDELARLKEKYPDKA